MNRALTKQATFIVIPTATSRGPEIKVDDRIREGLRREHDRRALSDYALGSILGGSILGGGAAGSVTLPGKSKKVQLLKNIALPVAGGLLGAGGAKLWRNHRAKRIEDATTARGSATGISFTGNRQQQIVKDRYRNAIEQYRKGEVPELRGFKPIQTN